MFQKAENSLPHLLHQLRRNERRRHSHDTFDIHHHAAVVTDADKLADHPFEHTVGDADLLAFHQVQLRRFEIEDGLLMTTCHEDETAHLHIGNDDRTTKLTVHDETDGQTTLKLLLQSIDALARGMDKDEVVDGRHQLTDTLTLLHPHDVTHRDKTFDVLCVEYGLQCQLATVGDTDGKPMEHVTIFNHHCSGE